MVKLKFYEPKDFPGVSYTLDELQSQYTATAEQALQKIEERSDTLAFPITIWKIIILPVFLCWISGMIN